jgi:hypothetical protein
MRYSPVVCPLELTVRVLFDPIDSICALSARLDQ